MKECTSPTLQTYENLLQVRKESIGVTPKAIFKSIQLKYFEINRTTTHFFKKKMPISQLFPIFVSNIKLKHLSMNK